MKYLSVCSGIEAATVAWHPLGWEPVLLSEIEDFPRKVLAHRQNAIDARQTGAAARGVPLWGDFTAIRPRFLKRLGIDGTIELVVGGTPCQDFSVAGKRAGLDGARGNLTLEFAHLLRRTKPRWFVWENVPGAFSLNNGKDFAAVLARFAGHAPGSAFAVPKEGWRNSGVVPPAGPGCYGLAWRVLDAQYVRVDSAPNAVPQRRRRVFVIGYLGDWRPAAAVLLERESMCGDTPPRREPGQGATHDIAPSLTASGRGVERNGESRGQDPVVAHTLKGEGFDASEDGTGSGVPLVAQEKNDNTPLAFDCKASGRNGFSVGDIAPTLRAMGSLHSHQNAGGHVAVLTHGGTYACQKEVQPTKAMRALRVAHDPEDMEWRSQRKSVSLRTPQVLQQTVHGEGLRSQTKKREIELDDCALSRPEEDPTRTLQSLWRGERSGCTPQERGLAGQPHGKPGTHLQSMPRSGTPQTKKMHDLRRQCEGAWVLQQALPSFQKVWRPSACESQPAHTQQVRRLTPLEAERLQNFPDNYTLIPMKRRRPISFDEARYYWRQAEPGIKCWCENGKWYTNAAPDGPRYKGLGNSMSVNCMRWIGKRIDAVAAIMKEQAA